MAGTENNFDTRALWRMIHDQKTSAVAGGNFACDGQPQSTAIAAAPGCAVERIKHPLAFRSGDARSIILYENRRRALALPKCNFAACASVAPAAAAQANDSISWRSEVRRVVGDTRKAVEQSLSCRRHACRRRRWRLMIVRQSPSSRTVAIW